MFRPYLNPAVAQACYCLGEAVCELWPSAVGPQQVFLANSYDEALSGAVKLARYDRSKLGLSTAGVLHDFDGSLEYFADARITERARVMFLPGLTTTESAEAAVGQYVARRPRPGFVAISIVTLESLSTDALDAMIDVSTQPDRPLLIVSVNRCRLFSRGPLHEQPWRRITPDVVVCDESFTEFGVPFGAFIAPPHLYAHWNNRRTATFHSTTYQPNTVSTLHFMNALRRAEPDFFRRHEALLRQIDADIATRRDSFGRRFSPSLAKLIDRVDLDQRSMKAEGHEIRTGGLRLFDAVAGVACSIRGHNPPTFSEDILRTGPADECRDELERRLYELTDLPHMLPAVSGASAVEQALKLGLVAAFPRTHVLALEGGYGGKTLFALTGTAKPALKAGLKPLYPHVTYVDPFSSDAIARIEAVFRAQPVGVIQTELVQGVGGVREVPRPVLDCLQRMRREHGCFLLVDEVQTGVYRTGPFVRSTQLDLRPDLLTIGKGISDMMFPFGLTLYGERVAKRATDVGCTLPQHARERHGYELGYRTALGVLRHAEAADLAERVERSGRMLAEALARELAGCKNVAAVRSFGLLIGIELEASRFPRRQLKKQLLQLALLAMMHHPRFPVVVGFCQYEPNVLKLTPPLSIEDGEISSLAAMIGDVLRRSPLHWVASAVRRGQLLRRGNRNRIVESGADAL
ncbi:MAG: aminotransferase class III-fold pyridoxal phosphate-dependent enzyme [Pirellulales bacterium]